MSAIKTLSRKLDVRLSNPKAYVQQRIAENAHALDRSGHALARVELANEALCRFTELVYKPDNADPITGRLLIAAPWGSDGWAFYGLRQWEARRLRKVLRIRQREYKVGSRPPLYSYDEDTNSWYLNRGDYPTPEAARFWLRGSAVTLAEWRAC